MPARSFLLDLPSKPTPKRVPPSAQESESLTSFEKKIAANPYAAILATPVRQCLYTRLLLPNAFLTKFIQAAGPDDQPWVVPERILPHALTRNPKSDLSQDNLRHGFGKWMATTSTVIDSAIREGRHRMINPSGFIRQDMAKLVYAQWSIRVAHEFKLLFRTSFTKPTKTRPSLRHPRFIVLDGSHAHPPGIKNASSTWAKQSSRGGDELGVDSASVLGLRSAQNVELPCVLYFGTGLRPTSETTTAEPETVGKDKAQEQVTLESVAVAGSPWMDINITKPTLPAFTKDKLPTRARMEVSQSNGRRFKTPVYDMEQLFAHHPQGLEVIKATCLDLLPHAQVPSDDQDTAPVWVGVRGSKETIPVCVGLWKMASMY
ncbi:hypothetical protein BGX24_001248 [Mortierella sp. AD032]|nr:hypothetical protein BGX24_001248 [Mortierella sp. AD032]